ncbi:hypothetical protein AVEN_256400-1 [Araneus ventricosus]|uniref:Uncharacterized protein n=1 Tax=Araneus ventricosus TaxID=182803 RepID=A0A4Y2FZI9_ARAVE|nr:hypothetical protein AVEN_256400-1 [Araneus ventricosus]
MRLDVLSAIVESIAIPRILSFVTNVWRSMAKLALVPLKPNQPFFCHLITLFITCSRSSNVVLDAFSYLNFHKMHQDRILPTTSSEYRKRVIFKYSAEQSSDERGFHIYVNLLVVVKLQWTDQ